MVKTSPSNAGGAGSIPGHDIKIPHVSQPKIQNINQKQYCNKFNKDFKDGPHQKNCKKKNESIASNIPPGVRGSKEAPTHFFLVWVFPNIKLAIGSMVISHSSWTHSEVKTEIEVTIVNMLNKLHNLHSEFTSYKCIRHFAISTCIVMCMMK